MLNPFLVETGFEIFTSCFMVHQIISVCERSEQLGDPFSIHALLPRSHAFVMEAVCSLALLCWKMQSGFLFPLHEHCAQSTCRNAHLHHQRCGCFNWERFLSSSVMRMQHSWFHISISTGQFPFLHQSFSNELFHWKEGEWLCLDLSSYVHGSLNPHFRTLKETVLGYWYSQGFLIVISVTESYLVAN